MKIAIFGATGMVGSGVFAKLNGEHELVLVARYKDQIPLLERYGKVKKHKVVEFDAAKLYDDWTKGQTNTLNKTLDKIGQVDGVVNCIGIIKPYMDRNLPLALFINGTLPHMLAASYGEKLIQITTDCVFSGIDGRAPYKEDSGVNPTDVYGFSKVEGEPWGKSLVLRTSVIGPELHGFVSLVEWVRKQAGKKIKGFTNHLWNGITTTEYGRIVGEVITNRSKYPGHGLCHIFGEDVSKYTMVSAIAEKYHIDCDIEKSDGEKLDRRLGTNYAMNYQLQIPMFTEMIDDLP